MSTSNALFSLNGRLVVVTGGLGQLGRQFTGALLANGAKVAIVDVPKVEDGLSRLGPLAQSDDVIYVSADVTCRASLEAGLAKIQEKHGTPYGLINNAALDSPPNAPASENGAFETYPEESWDRVMQVNAKGVFLACQVFGGAMAAEGRGSIVNVGSIYGILSPDQSLYDYRRRNGEVFFKPVAYAQSKSSLTNLTHYLATYWGGKGVRVNLVTFAGVFNNQAPDFLDRYCQRVPLGRMAREDEYNGAMVFLMSDASSYMTGSNMILDGGWSAW